VLLGSVIIPCYNEAPILGLLLGALNPDELEIIVVCNGCTDDSVSVARQYPGVKVLDIEKPSKVEALNLGDQAASYFPRFYIDSDILVDMGAFREVASVLESGEALVAAPRLTWNAENSDLPVRWFFQVWSQLPYVQSNLVGCGFYALSESGRAQFGKFPDIMSDDEFVRRQFSSRNRVSIATSKFQINCPRTLGDLVRIRARHYRNNLEIKEAFPHLPAPSDQNYGPSLRTLFARPNTWLPCLVYFAVWVASRTLAWLQFKGWIEHDRWEQDRSSRDNLV
jgi:glycosyltransferase involved in cell wall biosynthesis